MEEHGRSGWAILGWIALGAMLGALGLFVWLISQISTIG
jgi:hypothetical protein